MSMPRSNGSSGLDDDRRRMLALLGGTASVGLAGCSALLDDDEVPGDDDDDGDDTDDGDDDDDAEMSNADKAQAAWERVEANPDPEDQDVRDEAYIEIEEAVRDDMILMPLYHNLEERFWYDWVDVPRTGVLGGHHQQFNETTVENDTELNLINSTFSEIDPITSTDTASSWVIAQLYETLTHYPDGVAELENQLLAEFDVSEDGLEWTFTVEEGIEFHDGSELTADDVVYSLERLALSPNSERANFILGTAGFLGLAHEVDEDDGVGPFGVDPDSLGLEVVDEYTFEMEIAEPNPAVLDILTYDGFAVVPEGIVGDIPGYDGEVEYDEFATEMANGTGPFEFDFFDVDEEVRVTRNDDYHGEVADVDSVHWEIIEDDEAIFTYAMERNADIFPIPTPQYEPELIDAETDDRGREAGTYGPLENDETVNYLSIPELSTFYFAFNARNVPRPVRQAVAYVTDHEELVQEIFAGRGVEAFSFTPPGLWPTGPDGYEAYVDEWPYSPNETDRDAARDVLEADDITEDDPFELTLTTYESEVFQEAAELTQSKLAGTGVEFDIEEAPFGTLIGRGEDGDLEMYSLGWIWSWESVAYGHFGFEPKNTDTELMPAEATGYYLDWHVDLEEMA